MLRICAHCDRHVRATSRCPYCGSTESAAVPNPTHRVCTRGVALVALVASSVGAAACGDVSRNPFYGSPDWQGPAPVDAGRDSGGPLLAEDSGLPDAELDAASATDADASSPDAADADAADSADATTD